MPIHIPTLYSAAFISALNNSTRLGLSRLSVGVAIASLGLGLTEPAQAQVFQTRPSTIFEDVRLEPEFAPDPAVVHGISGGPQLATDVTGQNNTATGPCAGYIDTTPDHRMELTAFFNYLSLQVQSTEDTMLVVRGPGGSWCNDSYNGQNPGIAGQWFSGTYEIWVGSPTNDAYYPYIIRISGTEPSQ